MKLFVFICMIFSEENSTSSKVEFWKWHEVVILRKHARSVITWCNNSIILYDRQKKLMALGYGMQSRVKIQHSCVQAQLYRSHLCLVVEYGSNHVHFSWSGSIFCHLLQSNCIIKIEILCKLGDLHIPTPKR